MISRPLGMATVPYMLLHYPGLPVRYPSPMYNIFLLLPLRIYLKDYFFLYVVSYGASVPRQLIQSEAAQRSAIWCHRFSTAKPPS